MGLKTTTVGSLPKPDAVRRARRLYGDGDIDREALREVEVAVIPEVIEVQQQAGIDLLVAGEIDRGDMVSFFAEGWSGFEPAGLVRCFGNRYYRKPIIVDAVERNEPLAAPTWELAQQAADKPVKANLTGPYTLLDWSFDEHYGDKEEALVALTEAVAGEAEDLVAAGCSEIQIDEPAYGALPEDGTLIASALEKIREAVGDGPRLWLHLCYGELAPILDTLFALPVDALVLELSHADPGLIARFEDLPTDKMLVAGVVDVNAGHVPTAETIARTIEPFAKIVPADRLWLSPDCGLKTFSVQQAKQLMANLVGAAD